MNGYTTNNKYPEFPPIMADGRSLIASWQPEAVINDQLIKQTGITSNWQYRRYLTENSKQIKDSNFKEACNDIGYYKRFADDPSQSAPYLYKTAFDNATPTGYAHSDLKQIYLSREQLDARKYTPSTNI